MKCKVGDNVTIQDVNGELFDVTIEELHSLGTGNTYYRAGKRLFSGENIVSLPLQPDGIDRVVECSTRIVSTPENNERAKVLSEAEQLINGDRAKAYGDPSVNFGRLAQLWAPILGAEITPTQVALCLTQLKISRLINTPDHRDSYIDAAGYIGLAAELAKEQK